MWIAACALAFLLGSVPFALLLARLLTGVDIRSVGSGNVGATNASRAFPKPWRLPAFLAVYVLDAGKGVVPALLIPLWFGLASQAELAPQELLPAVLCGAAAVLGHCFSPFLRFKGGKGVATASGVMLVVDPVALGCGLAGFFLVFLLTRQVYLGSLTLGLGLAAGCILRDLDSAFGPRLPATVLTLAAAAFLFWTHRSNIKKGLAPRTAAGAAGGSR